MLLHIWAAGFSFLFPRILPLFGPSQKPIHFCGQSRRSFRDSRKTEEEAGGEKGADTRHARGEFNFISPGLLWRRQESLLLSGPNEGVSSLREKREVGKK